MEAKNEAIRDGAKARFAAKVTGIYIALAGFASHLRPSAGLRPPLQYRGHHGRVDPRLRGVVCRLRDVLCRRRVGDPRGKAPLGFTKLPSSGVWIFLALSPRRDGGTTRPSLLILGFINFAGAAS